MAHSVEHETVRTLSTLAERGVALAKAEFKLALAQNRPWVGKMGLGVALSLGGVLLAQLCVLLAALSPILIGFRPWWLVLLSVALAGVPAALCFFAARKAFAAAGDLRAAVRVSEPPPPDEIQGGSAMVTEHGR
jgi:hypothetical protein